LARARRWGRGIVFQVTVSAVKIQIAGAKASYGCLLRYDVERLIPMEESARAATTENEIECKPE
jgi:hypothetical protein